MTEIIGVRFKNAGKTYYFSPGTHKLTVGQRVVVETARGIECGDVVIANRMMPDEQIVVPLKERTSGSSRKMRQRNARRSASVRKKSPPTG